MHSGIKEIEEAERPGMITQHDDLIIKIYSLSAPYK